MNLYKPTTTNRADVVRGKHHYGFWFGAALGFTFAVFAWGVDAYLLARMNGLYPWIKFAGGAFLCILSGGITGWLAAKSDKPIIAFGLWVVTAFIFAWLTVALPLQITPILLNLIEPDLQGLLHYTFYEGFSTRIGVAYIWIGLFVALAGLLQIPLSDTAVFATSFVGKLSPMLVCLVLMWICGTIVDGLNNELLRAPIDALDATIQFSIDHAGQKIDRLEALRMHLGSLRVVQDVITPERKFIVSGYDELLGEVDVLVRFQKAWVEYKVLYNQPAACKLAGNITQ